MQINDITVPAAGSTTQYIPDPVGGWIYRVTTNVVVDQLSLNEFDAQLDRAKNQVLSAQQLVDELEPVQTAVATSVAAKSVASAILQ